MIRWWGNNYYQVIIIAAAVERWRWDECRRVSYAIATATLGVVIIDLLLMMSSH